jgi:hypothetical protein
MTHAGKTWVVISRVEWLLRELVAEPKNLLVITFTNKAAGELKVAGPDQSFLVHYQKPVPAFSCARQQGSSR